jgi:4-amino-4-deoxy-L-arabinose transferase-like glycosyltransferase
MFWGAMFFNNLFKTSPFDGFDPKAHINYVNYILQFHSLPLATDGWETYQPPLFYSIVALFFKVINHLLLNKSKAFLLSFKLVTFSCAIGQVYLACVAAKILFPRDNSKQMLATAVASVLPVTIYIAHYISNESLSAFLISASIVYTLRLVKKENRHISSFWFLGVLLGLSLLTKITILCFLPVILFVILYDALKKRSGLAETGKIFAEIFLPAIFI